jgi:hypothetical protein
MFEQTFKNIDDILWKEAGCATELDYTEQTSWILFLKYLDDLGEGERAKAGAQGKKYDSIIDAKYRWRFGRRQRKRMVNRVPVPPTFHQVAGGWRPRRHRHQEHVSVEHRQRRCGFTQGASVLARADLNPLSPHQAKRP